MRSATEMMGSLGTAQDADAPMNAAGALSAEASLSTPALGTHQSAAEAQLDLKRVLDLTISAALLVLLSPLWVAVAAVIKLADGGPVIFWQKRVGHFGREFWFPKFRSMRVGAEHLHEALLPKNDHPHGPTFKMKEDPRMTGIGRVVRTLSIDELPQLWSVLVGDMSLVGPRPPLPREVAQYSPTQLRRLEVRPGLTCIWQVSGRSTLSFSDQVLLDIEYIEKRSLWLDLKLLALTIPAVLSCRGAW